MLSRLLVVFWMALPLALSQSNYASQGNSIEYQPGLPPSTVLNGKVTKLDDISSMIFLNRTKAYLNCSQGSMQVELKFEEPFYGVAYADFDRNSACIFKGRGSTSAKLELPLKGTSFYFFYFRFFLDSGNDSAQVRGKTVPTLIVSRLESVVRTSKERDHQRRIRVWAISDTVIKANE